MNETVTEPKARLRWYPYSFASQLMLMSSVVVLGLCSASCSTRSVTSEEPEARVSRSAASSPTEPFSSTKVRLDLPLDPTFEGYSIVQEETPKVDAQGEYTVLFSPDEERSPDLEGIRDLDYIRENLKLTAEYDDEHHYVYCRIANTGQQDIILNDFWIGYFGLVMLKRNHTTIPRDSGSTQRYIAGIGANLCDNIRLPGRTIYQSNRGLLCWLRYGPEKKLGPDSKMTVRECITPPPQRGKGISFRDDLLDFDWAHVDGDEVEVVVCQHLANVVGTRGPHERFQIESNPIRVNLTALKEYKGRLTRYCEELLQETSQ